MWPYIVPLSNRFCRWKSQTTTILRPALWACALGLGCISFAQTPTGLVWEAEQVSYPPSAWLTNEHRPDRWTLWTQDRDADRKWSGGAVLRSPPVSADRTSPEEGAPPLRVRLTQVPAGRYELLIRAVRGLAASLDSQRWIRVTSSPVWDDLRVTNGVVEFFVDDRFSDPANPGPCYFDTITLVPVPMPPAAVPVTGHASQRIRERLDRGLIAQRVPAGVYLSWRLLQTDPRDTTFELVRRTGEQVVRLGPIFLTTDFLDSSAPNDAQACIYELYRAGSSSLLAQVTVAAQVPRPTPSPAFEFPLRNPSEGFQKCGVGDLDGDGQYDFVLKLPDSNIDPYEAYWKKSPGTYRLEAYRSDGTFLWSYDMGWAIEQGIWYSPYLVYDLDGDGRAEVAVKAGEGDPRDADGRVRSGPEWLLVLDGATGRERARVPWPNREGFGEDLRGYNYASRNQLAVAYLDGRTPCLIALRGTYTVMKADAWDFDGRSLRRLWSFDSRHYGRRFFGQGAHFTRAYDVDQDGRDEIILGSLVLDDTGAPLWCTGLGHPDHMFLGDLWPGRPGMEIYYGIETRQPSNGMCMVDARTGRILWGLRTPTRHIHSLGLCADIDARFAGAECYGADSVDHKPTGDRWLHAADGRLLDRSLDLGWGRMGVWWDADLQRELIMNRTIEDFRGRRHATVLDGTPVLVCDLVGDWREEIVVSAPGRFRMYSTTFPALDRRVTLMQDPLYRLDIAMSAMGYLSSPNVMYDLERTAPNLNVTWLTEDPSVLEIVVSAPHDRPARGRLALAGENVKVTPASIDFQLAPNQRLITNAAIRVQSEASAKLNARWSLEGERDWVVPVLLGSPGRWERRTPPKVSAR